MIIVNLILLIFLFYIIYILSYSMFRGAPFAAIGKNKIYTLLNLIEPIRGGKFLDLGSGDGRIVIEASKRGCDAYGFEINPLLVLISRINLKRVNSKGHILLQDYWKKNLSEYNYISVWGFPHMMGRLEEKLLKELKPGAKVASNHFKFPNWKIKKTVGDIHLYVR